MISHLKGNIIYKDLKILIIDCNGVGYKVTATTELLLKAEQDNDISAWIYTVVREDILDLFGFISKQELDFFELLLSISGIGPKSALNILNVASIDSIRNAVLNGETGHLTKVSGISKKIADKIVLELKGKISHEDTTYQELKEEVDTLEALKALGFSHKDSREVLKDLPANLSTSEKIKEALKKLSK